MYGCMNVWMYGCMSVWMYECTDVWMYECMNVSGNSRSTEWKRRISN